MRRVSPKRRQRIDATADWRKQLAIDVGRCEFCGLRDIFEVHEVARGTSRDDALDQAYAVLVLCRDCHRTLERLAGDDQRALGLVLLRRNRPDDFNLQAFYDLTQRNNFPSRELVKRWAERLSFITER